MSEFNLFYMNKTKFKLDLSADREIIAYLKRLGYPLLFILKNQNVELCLEAINQKHYTCIAMEQIKNQTEELCIEAVKNNGMALQYVKNQNNKICLLAVQQNGMALHYVKNQTHEICLLAVQQNGMALQYVKNQTHEICLLAIRQNGLALQFVKNKDYKILVISNKITIKTDDICSICISQNENEWCELVNCKHVFHKDCLMKWIKEKESCPNCRNDLQF